MAFSSRFLYVSTDVFSAGGRLVLRIPLSDLAAGGTINYGYTDASKSKTAWGGHLVQQTSSQAVWVGHQDNSTLEVFTMPDGGNTYSSFTVKVATWPNGTHSSKGPDGNDWLTKLKSFPNFAITGGVQRPKGHVVLAWSASKGKGTSNGFNFPNTHGRVVELDLGAKTVVSEMQIWNNDYAFAYPNLAVNGRDEVAVILGWGGKNDHANSAMGIIGDFVVWYQNGSTRTVQRFGDYLTTRPQARNQSLFSGYGYYVTSVSGDTSKCTYHPIYVRYGRYARASPLCPSRASRPRRRCAACRSRRAPRAPASPQRSCLHDENDVVADGVLEAIAGLMRRLIHRGTKRRDRAPAASPGACHLRAPLRRRRNASAP